jgi:hypothetical protein
MHLVSLRTSKLAVNECRLSVCARRVECSLGLLPDFLELQMSATRSTAIGLERFMTITATYHSANSTLVFVVHLLALPFIDLSDASNHKRA